MLVSCPMLRLVLAVLAASFAVTAAPVVVAAQTLTVTGRDAARTYTVAGLLADPAMRELAVANDPVFKRAMTYRALPMAVLLRDARIGDGDYVQARAVDDFSVGIPGPLLAQAAPGQPEAFLAVENPARPWPVLSKGTQKYSAGPFYIVWRVARPGQVSSEYWVYRLAALTVTDSPDKRWPALGVAADVPAADPVRRGLDRFVAVCMACHRFNGAGEAEQGPDLGRPMNPVEYFQPAALKKLLRDPESVRSWPERKMPAFDAESLSDSDLDAIVAWLTYKNQHR